LSEPEAEKTTGKRGKNYFHTSKYLGNDIVTFYVLINLVLSFVLCFMSFRHALLSINLMSLRLNEQVKKLFFSHSEQHTGEVKDSISDELPTITLLL